MARQVFTNLFNYSEDVKVGNRQRNTVKDGESEAKDAKRRIKTNRSCASWQMRI